MISDLEARSKWRQLFSSGEVTPQTLRDAKELVEDLHLESPLRSRLTNELAEIREMRVATKRKKK